jgi:hypothetical protein
MIQVFWNVTLWCWEATYQRSGEPYLFFLQGQENQE